MSADTAFVVLGDWGRGGGHSQSRVAQAMGQAAAEAQSRFVISVGDNFYPAGVSSAADPQWKASFEDVYTAASLQTPWYAALGNHDYRGRPGAQVEYGQTNPRWRMPNRYYAVSGDELGSPDLDLFVLDTTPIAGGYEEAVARLGYGRTTVPHPRAQVAWLSSALQRSRARWKVVVGHHPIHSGGHHGGSEELAAKIEPLLQAHGVQAYLCGHDHVLQHIRVGGVNHVCTGAGASAGHVAAIDGTLFMASQAGFALFTRAADTMHLTFRDAAGRELYQGEIPNA